MEPLAELLTAVSYVEFNPELAINEYEEREFWMTHNMRDYFDHSKSIRSSISCLELRTQSISLLLPPRMMDSIKITANRQDVLYQSLIKICLN